MAAITIRKMREEDRAAAMAILERWNMAPRPPSAAVPDPERSTLYLENSFVALSGEVVIGVASYILHGTQAETASLAVDPAWLGRSVGERLQSARLAEMKVRGVERVQTESDRPDVIAWYVRKFGYRVLGTRSKKHAFGREDIDRWTVLELDLKETPQSD